MAEFENTNQNNNENMNENKNEINNQNQNNTIPEYSFLAEQIQNNSVPNQAQDNLNSGNPQVQRSPYPENNQVQGSPYPVNNQVQSNSYPGNNQVQGNLNPDNRQLQGNPYYGNSQPQGSQYSGNYQTQDYPNYNNQGNGNYANGNNIPNNYYYQNQYNNGNSQYSNPYIQNNIANGRKEKRDKKPGRGGKLVKFLGKAVCFGLLAGIGFLGFQKIYSVISPGTSIEKAIDALDSNENSYEIGYTQPASVQYTDYSTVTEVTKNTLPSIVSIDSTATQSNDWFGQSYEIQGSGSGIIVGKTEKEILIATNNHVVEGTDKISVTFMDGTKADAIIKGTDATADLAVVSIKISDIPENTLSKIVVAKLGNSDEVKVGEMAIAIGNALGYGQSITVGYISAKDREVDVSDGYDGSKKMVLLQTDAAINPGNSGGALLNNKGEVIGINTVKYASNDVEGMGYAIPISKATPIITELMSREILSAQEQGYLGIGGGDVTEQDSQAYNMPIGVFINELAPGGAAEKAGLVAGDIITGVDDIKVTSISQLKEYVNSRRAGTDVKVTYMRYANGKYEEGTLTVTLGQNPNLNKSAD